MQAHLRLLVNATKFANFTKKVVSFDTTLMQINELYTSNVHDVDYT